MTCSAHEKTKQQRHTAFKGIELYSWRETKTTWCFSLLLGTNREKSIDQITNPATKIVGVKKLKKQLANLPVGENIYWINIAKEPVPPTIVNDITSYSKQKRLKLKKFK